MMIDILITMTLVMIGATCITLLKVEVIDPLMDLYKEIKENKEKEEKEKFMKTYFINTTIR